MSGQQVDAEPNISLYSSENDNILLVQDKVSCLLYHSHTSLTSMKTQILSRPSRAATTNSLGSSNVLDCYHNHTYRNRPTSNGSSDNGSARVIREKNAWRERNWEKVASCDQQKTYKRQELV
jgi:hypothetical protein